MTEEYDRAMLRALERLVARYRPNEVARLAELLRDPKAAERLANSLESAAATTRKRKAATRRRRADRAGMGVLRELRLSDSAKHAVVAEIRRELVSGTILPFMGDLRRFAMIHDLSLGKATSRTAAIAPFLRSLSQLSLPEMISLRDATIYSNVDDRSLDRWRDVIVRRPPGRSDSAEEDP